MDWQARQCGADALHHTDFLTLEEFLSRMQDSLNNEAGPYKRCDRVRFEQFMGMIPALRQSWRARRLDPVVVWTQIRSFIKGSIEAAMAGRPLSLEQYLSLSAGRCRLAPEQRREAYSVFEAYEKELASAGLWDESGRTLGALARWLRGGRPCVRLAGGDARYDRVYVDEVQDCTQAEIALFFVAAGMDSRALFLAGDPAQTVAEGVDFRFEEVRAVVHHLSGGQERLERTVKLAVNYRSHAGILACASAILSTMLALFPESAKALQPDRGIYAGPLPAYWRPSRSGGATLRSVLSALPLERLVVVCPDERQQGLASLLPETLVFGVREAKGLEFAHVAHVLLRPVRAGPGRVGAHALRRPGGGGGGGGGQPAGGAAAEAALHGSHQELPLPHLRGARGVRGGDGLFPADGGGSPHRAAGGARLRGRAGAVRRGGGDGQRGAGGPGAGAGGGCLGGGVGGDCPLPVGQGGALLCAGGCGRAKRRMRAERGRGRGGGGPGYRVRSCSRVSELIEEFSP